MGILLRLNEGYKQIKRFYDIKKIAELIQEEDFCKVDNVYPEKIRKIAFVVESMYQFAGGSTSILRIAEYLSHNYEILFVVCSSQNECDFRKNAKTNYDDFPYSVVQFKSFSESDIIIATAWQTAYYAKRLVGYKMYFVQDYEPYFYEYGEKYLLARNTYKMGFHMISLGQWNKNKIIQECGNDGIIDVIPFPFERKEYHYLERNFEQYTEKKEIKLAVYIKEDPKRIPVILQYMLTGLEKEFKRDGKKLSVYWYGWDKAKKVLCGTNMGRLKRSELEKLYHSVDFGMVASITNISLVPLEMMACGLPIIEFEDGSFRSFFGEKSAILTNFNYKELYKKIDYVINHPDIMKQTDKKNQEILLKFDWTNSCRKFENILNGHPGD